MFFENLKKALRKKKVRNWFTGVDFPDGNLGINIYIYIYKELSFFFSNIPLNPELLVYNRLITNLFLINDEVFKH